MNKSSQWYKDMMRKYGSEEAISKIMSKNSNKSKRNTGGIFNAASPEAAQEARRRGGLNRGAKIRAQEQGQVSSQSRPTRQEIADQTDQA